jgi:hypothetical protein
MFLPMCGSSMRRACRHRNPLTWRYESKRTLFCFGLWPDGSSVQFANCQFDRSGAHMPSYHHDDSIPLAA